MHPAGAKHLERVAIQQGVAKTKNRPVFNRKPTKQTMIVNCKNRPLHQTWTQTTAPIPNLYWQSIVASANGGQVAGVASTAPFVIANIGASGYRCYRAFNLFTATVK